MTEQRKPVHCDKHEQHESWCPHCISSEECALDDENEVLRERIAELERQLAAMTAERDELKNKNKQLIIENYEHASFSKLMIDLTDFGDGKRGERYKKLGRILKNGRP